MSSTAPEFVLTRVGEPHRRRRIEILRRHPQIASLFGWDRWPKYRMAGALLAQLAIAFGIARLATAAPAMIALSTLVVAAYALGAIFNHYGGVIIHEASHDLCARTRRGNRWVAIFANLPKVLPYAMTFRRHHLDHHYHLGVVGKDNDLAQPFERRLVGNGAVPKALWLFFYPVFGALCRGFLRAPDRWELTNVGVQLLFNMGVWLVLGPWALLYLAVSTWFSASLHPIAGHFIHEHYLWSESQETYSYYGPLNRVTLNMGYHVEHHDFPRVPGAKLPELHTIAREHYAPLVSHLSWTKIFWTFVRVPRLSHASRFVRSTNRG